MVLLHRVWRKHPVNVDFLGFYAPNDNQYSERVHGLIGKPTQEAGSGPNTALLLWRTVTEFAYYLQNPLPLHDHRMLR